MIANLQLEVRSDISVLAASYPDIAHQFQDFRDRLNSPSRPFESSVIENISAISYSTRARAPDSSKLIVERRELVRQFDDLLQHIRMLQGFEDFLRGRSKAELHSLAEAGPIVVFNVSTIRSDAFLITTHKIRVVKLPSLTSDSVEDYAKRFLCAINDHRYISRYNRAKHDVKLILEWLWDAAVEPALEKLGFNQMTATDEVWPKVWWVGSGLLNVFPIHASGYHDSIPRRTAIDRVISLYAPTIKSLSYAREKVVRTEQFALTESAIIVTMPTTPEKEALPNVEKECKELQKVFSAVNINTLAKQNPTWEEVIFELPKHTIVHFACHGYSANDPSQSSLLLEDWKSIPLTVSDLTSLNIKLAKFAYLSACHTSVTREIRLLDESINLASAIQLSGYPSVLGTLWQVTDMYSAEVARDVYKWSFEANGRLDTRRLAEGLHKAVRDLRNKTCAISRRGSDPLIWAPYVCIGV